MGWGAWRYRGTIVGRGLRWRCPACGLGRLYDRRWHMRDTCPYCTVRFERASGETLGGVYLNATLTVALALGGYFAADTLFHPPVPVQMAIWMGFTLLFPLLFYRSARGLWASILYLTGAVYPDPDYEREYIRAERQPDRQRQRPKP